MMPDRKSINAILGTPASGLIGPFAFPFEWTFQRNRSGRKSSRKPLHRLPSIKGMPLFIEAVPPPVKQLREKLRELGAAVHIHAHDLGEDFFTLFVGVSAAPNDVDEVVLDFTQALDVDVCPRYGTWKLINRLRDRFYKRYTELQQRAIENGGYFPPPTILRARIHRAKGVRMEMGFSNGFLPDNKLLVVTIAML